MLWILVARAVAITFFWVLIHQRISQRWWMWHRNLTFDCDIWERSPKDDGCNIDGITLFETGLQTPKDDVTIIFVTFETITNHELSYYLSTSLLQHYISHYSPFCRLSIISKIWVAFYDPKKTLDIGSPANWIMFFSFVEYKVFRQYCYGLDEWGINVNLDFKVGSFENVKNRLYHFLSDFCR